VSRLIAFLLVIISLHLSLIGIILAKRLGRIASAIEMQNDIDRFPTPCIETTK